MKMMKKLFAIALVAAMVMALCVTALAADTGTITIDVPENTTTATTYEVYKVFDATVNATDSTKVSYTLPSGKTLTGDMLTYFDVDTAGNVTIKDAGKDSTDATKLSSGAIAAIAGWVKASDKVATVSAEAGADKVTTKALAYGYYYITTTTGSVVTIDTNNANPTVEDKNTLTAVVKSAGTEYDKDSLKAIAQVGTNQDFTAQITVGNGATKLVFSDTMTNMTYVADSLAVKKGTTPLAKDTDYTLTVSEDSATITVTFKDVATKLNSGDVITLNYKGLVTSDALSVNPATNTATITTDNNNTSTSETIKVYNAKFTVTKKDGEGKALAGAGFVIKNSDGAYYCLAGDGKSITWYTHEDGQTLAQAITAGKVTEYISDANGAVTAFTGLKAGTYTLVESTVPGGYNKAADQNFTISGTDYTTTNLEQSATVKNEQGAEMPSTGGIGTKIFYGVGAVLVIGAGVVLMGRKRAAD